MFIRILAIFFSILIFHTTFLCAECGLGGYESDLIKELMIVEAVNQQLSERFPVYYNNLLGGGYCNMPSARMGREGDFGVGYSSVYPYRNYNLRFQFFDRLELYGSYRIFVGVDDPILSTTGFGEKSDKGANAKLALLHPEETNFVLPGFAIGYEDFLGTKGFESAYVVCTQVIPQWDLECSIGYGMMRLHKWFGGLHWIPFRQSENPYLKNLVFVAEYDATDYKSEKSEPHPNGRSKKSSFNYGIKYRLWNLVDFSANYNKGENIAFSFSSFYNFGQTKGFFPKINDPCPYRCPRNTQPLGPLRPTDALAQELVSAFNNQGFEVQEAWLSTDCQDKTLLKLRLYNYSWRYEDDARNRLNALLANLIPSNISEVIVVLMDEELPIQEYRFCMEYVRLHGESKLCPYELYVLSPMRNVSLENRSCLELIFKEHRPWWNIEFFPKTYTAFGSASGKFKWLLGIQVGIDGYLPQDWYYSVLLGYTLDSCLYSVKDVDRLNPSQIINVRTDAVNYAKDARFTVDEAYIQKWWNLGKGCFSTLSLGLFEPAYGGIAGEFLYFPVNSSLAFGIEGGVLKKRTYTGIGFTDHVRKLEGFNPTYKKFHGGQIFANLYYNFDALDIDLLFKAGKFLANDWGVRSELSRYYPSGIRIYMWYTYTGAKDYVNDHRYHDHGVGITIPLDILYTYSSRDQWGYAMSAWLRDVGAIANTGIPLYWQIRSNRERKARPQYDY